MSCLRQSDKGSSLEYSKTINIDIPKMNSYFREWIDEWGGEESHNHLFQIKESLKSKKARIHSERT